MLDTITNIPEGVKDSIFQYRFTEFLKKHGKPFSGKFGIWDRLQQALNQDRDFKVHFNEFIKDELSSGKSRQVFICNFSIESLAVLSNLSNIKAKLAARGFPTENFNNLLEANIENGEMVYLNIDIDGENHNIIEQISMAFLNIVTIEVENEGVVIPKEFSSYVWIDLFPEKKYLQIKVRPLYANHMINMEESKRVFDYYWELLKKTFGIVYTDMSETKNTLYKIFKDLTEKAEAPYIKKVESIMTDVEKQVADIAVSIGLPNHKDPVDISNRLARLFERALILSDLSNYKGYEQGKVGIVDRIDFSDQSGARVNALSGDEGIEVADIYFDTRETLDELKKLNKIWIRWFVPAKKFSMNQDVDSQELKIEHVETRIEVLNNRVAIYFLNVQSVPKEVQEHVLSLFRLFEEGENPEQIS